MAPVRLIYIQVHSILKELVRKSVGETQVNDFFKVDKVFLITLQCSLSIKKLQELKQFPTLQAEVAAAAVAALERFRDESKKTALRLVDMENGYLTVEFFRKLPQEVEKGGNPAASSIDRYGEGHLRRIGELFIFLDSLDAFWW